MKTNFNVDFDVDLDNDNYGRINISATSVKNLNEIFNKFGKIIDEMNIKDEPSPKGLTAEMARFKNEIRVGPVKFNDGKTGYFYVKIGNFRHPNMTWEDAMYELEYSGFSVPNKDELDLIIRYKDLIDSIDTSEKGKFSDIGSGWIWSSSEYNSGYAWIQKPSDGSQCNYNKGYACWLVPFMRVIC